jgi:retron-type reverse transcriptase
VKFTALLHHVTIDMLRDAFLALKRRAAPGVDGVTWEDYEAGMEGNLQGLHARVHSGGYRAMPVRRRFIPKPGSDKQRPLGIAALEDKIVQRALIEVLNAIYEEDFLGFSYGFRPGRGQHDALDALSVAICQTPVRQFPARGVPAQAQDTGRPHESQAPGDQGTAASSHARDHP